MTSVTYKKRTGTSGIRGQLYETKLISLINFRATHNGNINGYSLATNMDNIGTFDDICLRFKVNKFDKPLAVFIQAKHRENDTLLKNDWVTYFDSYMKVRQAFNPSNTDLTFKGKYEETECFFVIYTTARGDSSYKAFDRILASSLNDVISTAQCGQQTVVTNKDLECLYKVIMKEQVTQLAKPIAKLLYDEITDFQMFMENEHVFSYHVILAQNFCEVSDIQTGRYRLANVREEFFDTDDEILMTFKSSLYKEVIEKRKVKANEFKTLVAQFFDNPTDVTILSKVIGCVITNKNGRLEFNKNQIVNNDLKRQLSKVYIPDVILVHAIEIAGRDILTSKQKFKVPVAFGNKDIIIRKDERITYLASQIVFLISKSNNNNVITIDESVDKGFLKLNGGIASAVGNLLVFDENSKMMKFNENFHELGDVAKRLLTKLKKNITLLGQSGKNETINLNKYRIDVKIKTFPKLTFECNDHDKNMAKDFFNRLLFYTNQADEKGTGEILKQEIEKYQSDQVSKNSFLSHLIFLKYHDDIQSWWMLPNNVSYLTDESKIYENAMKAVVSEPPITVMNKMYEIKAKEADVTFNYDVMSSLEFDDQPGYIVITESALLTLYKVKQYLEGKDHVVLDMTYTSKLRGSEYETLLTELENTNKDKIIIILFSDFLLTSNISFQKIEDVAKIVEKKQAIIITDCKVVMVQNLYSNACVVNDNKISLTDLSEDTQHNILQKNIVFQGHKIKLKSIVDEFSKPFVRGHVLSKIIHNETISVGEAVDMSNYDIVKNMYIGRRVFRNKKRTLPVTRIQTDDDTLIRLKHLQYVTCHAHNKKKVTESCKNEFDEQQESLHIDTLHDIDDDVVVLTTKPGMGKSTLFRHLFLQTKKVDPTIWIVRINLVDHCQQFSLWKRNKTVIDILECLKFISLAILGDKVTFALQELNNKLSLEYCIGDELLIFELKMFVHFYNRKKLIFLFDGFDEVCPLYTNEVLTLLRILESYPKYIKHKIWITSRPCKNLKSILENEFDVSYDLENYSWVEQNMFLYMFWIKNEILLNNHETQLDNIYDFIDFMSQSPEINSFLNKNDPSELNNKPHLSVYINFICYLKVELKSAPPCIINALNSLYDRCFAYITFINDFMTTPFNLYLIAHYFHNKIKGTRIRSQEWNSDINVLTFYDHFVETKLKSIRIKHKQNFRKPITCSETFPISKQSSMPDPMRLITYESLGNIDNHKILGAYAIFHENRNTIFNTNEFDNIEDMIEMLKYGNEKPVFISDVVNDIPIFTHKTIAEYFAVKFICDKLRDEQSFDKQKPIFELILNVLDVNPSLKVMFDNQLKVDSQLRASVVRNKKGIDELLFEKSNKRNNVGGGNKSSLWEAIQNDPQSST